MEQNRKPNIKKWHIPFLTLLIIGTILIAYNTKKPLPYQSAEGVIFGTVFHVKYQYGRSLMPEMMAALEKVDSSLSMFNEESVVSKINRGETTEADSMLLQVLQLSQKISKETDGHFDITVAPLVNAWGFGFKNNDFPDSTTIDSILEYVGWDKIRIAGQKVEKQDERIVLDFSAIAKGFGVDQVAELRRSKGIENFLVEIGGEIVAEGVNNQQKPWRIGIHKPADDSTQVNQDIQQMLGVKKCAMATSGNYRNFYIHEGQKVAHTINPHTGFPAQQDVLSSTVMAPSAWISRQ